jgi:D-glycero-D-manno-heptose 1,7-bisphosphate phosphatase
MRLQPAVILDRDGIINYDSEQYIKSWADFRFLPGALTALRQLRKAGREVYIATNQAGISRGIYDEQALRDILLRMQLTISQAGGAVHGIVYCVHHPDQGCDCRKPAPGMLLKLATKFGLDLRRSVFTGDRCSDVQAGQAVGCRTILVQNKFQKHLQESADNCPQPPDFQADSLVSAVEIILREL